MANTSFRTQLADRRRRQLSDAVAELRLLPTTVAVPMKVLQLQRNPLATMADYAAALAADPSLTSKVLALANSAAFAPTQRITRITDAVTRIGLKNLLSLVFGLSIGGIFNKLTLPAPEGKGLWRASLLKAVTARELATRLDPAVAEEAFICGLLQDISLPIIFATDPSAWPETAAILDQDPKLRKQRELAMYSTDHATLGKVVAMKLGLPELYQTAIGVHHDESEVPANAAAGAAPAATTPATPPASFAPLGSPALGKAIEFAAALPHRLNTYTAAITNRLAAKLKALDPEGLTDHPTLLKAIGESYAGTLQLLGESDESSAAVKEFLQAVGGEVAGILEGSIGDLVSQISKLEQRGAELESKVAELKQQAQRSECDPLTKALTPDAFVVRAERFFELARGYETPCAIGVADITGFSKINETYNHVVGDEVLAEMASKLAEALRGKGIIARIGPDDFAMLMVCSNQRELAAEADRLESVVAALTIGSIPGGVSLPATIGLVWLGVPAPDLTLEVAMQRAAAALQDAKAGGGRGRRVLARTA